MTKPILTIGMIVKNEIRCIQRCLDSLRPLRNAIPCQLIIADTGSTDGTREIVQQQADLMFDFTWINDFAAARNAVLDRAEGEWFLTLDADEWFDADISDVIHFFQSDRHKKADGAELTIRNYHSYSLKGSYADAYLMRFVRMDTGVRFEGTIHEHYVTEIENLTTIHVMLHHDGYASNSEEDKKKKARRNMDLLKIEHEKDPDNRIILNQCLESVWPFDEYIDYATEGMERVKRDPKRIPFVMEQALFKNSVVLALHHKNPIALEWLEWGMQYQDIRESVYFGDIAYQTAVYFYKDKNYKETLVWVKRYENFLKLLNKWSEKDILRITKITPVQNCAPSSQEMIHCIGCTCMMETEADQKEAVRRFLKLDPIKYMTILNEYMLAASYLVTDFRVQKQIADMLQKAYESEDKLTAGLWEHYGLQQFAKGDAWRMFRCAPQKLGQYARALEATGESLSQAILEIENWDDIPAQVITHIMEQEVPLPDSFYALPAEKRRKITNSLLKSPRFLEEFLKWSAVDAENDTLPRLQFLYDCANAACGMFQWEEHDQQDTMLHQFCRFAELYLHRLYHPDVVQKPENWVVMAEEHRFALCILEAEKKLETSDYLAATRLLRQAIQAYPKRKDMVEYMLADIRKRSTPENPELVMLAQKVNTILSSFPPNDPRVLALKQSPMYQRVAYLLEKK